MKTGEQVKVGQHTYTVVRTRNFEHQGAKRVSLTLKKPKGSKLFNAILYETGKISDAVPIN